jgi:ribonuclease BN (tRNA processing enzyme)
MKVTIWGCRGSLPSPGPEKNKYGGNTSCVELLHNETCIILDGGSGIQRLGSAINTNIKTIHILLTHLHLDHTMGLGFFLPLYNPNITVHLWGPTGTNESLIKRLRRYFSPPLFPVRLNELPAHPIVHEINHSVFFIDDVKITSEFICHPGPTLGFRLECGHAILAYMPDHEPALGSANFPNDPTWTSGYNLAKDADLLMHDAQYKNSEYATRVGWGHSSMADAMRFAEMCKVKKLLLFHHDPAHTDVQLEQLFEDNTLGKKIPFDVELCTENTSFEI